MATATNPPPPSENAPYSPTAAINLCVAIPDSSISDQQAKRDKSIKIAQFARAFSIFRVKKVYIYHDKTSNIHKNDSRILKTILAYLDTPQYLRRRLYPLTPELEFAGILHPIKAPHHKKFKGTMHVDAGLGMMIPCDNISSAEEGKKVNVKFISGHPKLRVTKASTEDTNDSYWGYDIVEVPSLHTLLKEIKNKRNAEIVIASRNGSPFKLKEDELLKSLKSIRNVLIVFGAPKRAVEQILSGEGQNIENYKFTLNMFPFQGTETVRLEEAIFGTLAILNNNLQIDTTNM